ncbi:MULTISPECIES: type II toxin-antitoxin system RelE/ParE family toxin [Sulfurimonas]|uniref:type II toxin-antitoxin system RelE/ParE family toxin n=1 Tax=Sulfurimonas TaxID=202746 RepID=UPI0012640D60|nr:type II toxin-antitoxin system RelE/ParE family toxin [Sulfurimonas indica]
MKIKIYFTKTASNKLEQITEYIYEKTQSKQLTHKYLHKLKEFIVATLETFPKAGRPADEIYKATRKLVYQSYSIIYMYDEEKKSIYVMTLYRENLP